MKCTIPGCPTPYLEHTHIRGDVVLPMPQATIQLVPLETCPRDEVWMVSGTKRIVAKIRQPA